MANRNDYEYMNEDSIQEDLLCPLCTDPLYEPMCAEQCGHTFCRQCITSTFRTMSQCPTCRHDLTLEDFHPVNIRPFLNQLNQLLVKCNSCSEMNIQRNNFNDHFNKCPHGMVSCPAVDIKCDWTGKSDEVQSHVDVCPLVKIRPLIIELNAQVKQQSEQIHFLSTILKNSSKQHKKSCEERQKTINQARCDFCGNNFVFDEHADSLHICPNTDYCFSCVQKHFPCD